MPVIGTTIFIILTSILLVLTDVSKLPLALGVFVILQVVQTTVVQPRLQGRALGLNPMALVVAMAVFTLFFGLLGALVAAPLTAAVYHVLRYVGREWERSEHAGGRLIRARRRASAQASFIHRLSARS